MSTFVTGVIRSIPVEALEEVLALIRVGEYRLAERDLENIIAEGKAAITTYPGEASPDHTEQNPEDTA